MSLLSAFFIYLLVWWVVIFAVLPLGVERHDEAGKGYDAGAPKNANMKKKLVLTTVISAVIVLAMHILVELNVIRWTEWFSKGFD